jgi:hypothetical protein
MDKKYGHKKHTSDDDFQIPGVIIILLGKGISSGGGIFSLEFLNG